MRGLTVTVQLVAACALLTAGTAVAQPDGLAHAVPGPDLPSARSLSREAVWRGGPLPPRDDE
jgi:hypothetical protein